MTIASDSLFLDPPVSPSTFLSPALLATQSQLLEELLAIGTALSATTDLETLLALILTKSREITWSDAGSVFLVERQQLRPYLRFHTAQNASCPEACFESYAIPLTPDSLVGYVAQTGQSLNLADVYALPPEAPYHFNPSLDQQLNYRTRSVLVLPMQNGDGKVVGVLQLINHKIHPDWVVTPETVAEVTQAYSQQEERIVRSLASQAAISVERNQLQISIETLFAGFVTASVQVIESRDPTTAGHSERVADLTVRLGEEVSRLTQGALRSIHFNSQQLREIRYAALLHDFGKVGVPEAILNKQKKLFPQQQETIQQRFAFAERTLEWECAERKLKVLLEHSGHDASSEDCNCQRLTDLDQQLTQQRQQLKTYWHLLLAANEPAILEQEAMTQLQELANYHYRDLKGNLHPLLTIAELEQLAVNRGNLTPAERWTIETHVSHTYEFLKRIPWTQDLQAVPTIACGHHERLNGTGYPLGLQGSEIPIQAQMMAITDIYDALTASDRPYKKALPVQQSLVILRQEASSQKINAELVTLFEQRQVFTVLGHVL